MVERQEIYCHNCGGYVQFDQDLSIDGNHLLVCPKCDHQHYRVVKNGVITAERWGQDPSQVSNIVSATNITYSSSSAYMTTGFTSISFGDKTFSYSGTATYYIKSSWLNTQSG